MWRLLWCFGRDARGVTTLEYAFLAVGMALAIFAGAQALSSDLNSAFTDIGNDLVGLF